MKTLPIKVCGMREKENILSVSSIKPAFMGFIFYSGSKRYMANVPPEDIQVPIGIKKVGVFVNELTEEILLKAGLYKLDLVQLHGNELPEQCKELQDKGLKVIKAFSIDENFDFQQLEAYQNHICYFLFDAKGDGYGGNGIAFNWDILNKYHLKIPFFLSGGIDSEHVEKIREVKHKNLFAVDLNSRFEIEPGFKDVEKLKKFMEKIKD